MKQRKHTAKLLADRIDFITRITALGSGGRMRESSRWLRWL